MYLMKNIRFRYDHDWVLDDVNLSIQSDSFLGLIGPNGSGKTTLLKILAGLLIPALGEVELEGRQLKNWSNRERARALAFVPQESHFLYPYTVIDVVLMGRAPYSPLMGFDRPVDIDIARKALGRVGLSHLSDRMIQTLSGGERQMVIIARALAQEPKVLLLDEPTAYLDLSHQIDIYQILFELNKNEGLTVVVVSHDVNLAALYCKNLILLKKGKIHASGPPKEVLTTALLQQVYGCETLIDAHPTTGRPRITLIPNVEI